MPKSVLTAVSAFDSHYPKVDKPTWSAVLDYVRRNPVGLFVFGGDSLDCEAVSHHTKGKPIFRPQGQMRRDLDGFDKHMLRPIEAALPKDAEKIFLIGNHERFMDDLICEQPELDGLLSIAGYLDLAKRGWTVIPQGGHYKKGHLKWVHGDVLSGGANVVRKALDTFVENLVFGHLHTFASATKVLPHSRKYKWQSWTTGCVGKLDANYLRSRATGWLNGAAITEFYQGGRFNHYPVTIFDGRFAYGGKLYGR